MSNELNPEVTTLLERRALAAITIGNAPAVLTLIVTMNEDRRLEASALITPRNKGLSLLRAFERGSA